MQILFAAFLLAAAVTAPATAQTTAASPAAPAPAYDAELAKSLGGNENGLRGYVMVILKTGPKRVPDGPARDQMFKGHFANMERLGKEKKLVMAGPLDGVDGLRGIFVFATTDIEEAKKWVATDPVIISGEMVADCHKFFSSAALMALGDIHNRIHK